MKGGGARRRGRVRYSLIGGARKGEAQSKGEWVRLRIGGGEGRRDGDGVERERWSVRSLIFRFAMRTHPPT